MMRWFEKLRGILFLPRLLRIFCNAMFARNRPKEPACNCRLIIRVAESLARQKTNNDQIAGIVFSMDRAMQLHALLGSYRDQVMNAPRLTVIYRVTSPGHAEAYNAVFQEFEDIIELAVQQETRESFRGLVLEALNKANAKNIFFLVDDNLFSESVDIREFASHASTYCVPTLRHGENLSKSYVVQKPQRRPDLFSFQHEEMKREVLPTDLLAWCWNCGELDWAYPLSVDGHILQRDEVIAMAHAIEFNSPNTFEGNLQVFKAMFEWRTGLCYKKSRLVNIPYNRVQSDIENIHGEVHQDYMLEKWNEGYRIHRSAYYGVINESAHQEMPLKLIKAEIE